MIQMGSGRRESAPGKDNRKIPCLRRESADTKGPKEVEARQQKGDDVSGSWSRGGPD